MTLGEFREITKGLSDDLPMGCWNHYRSIWAGLRVDQLNLLVFGPVGDQQVRMTDLEGEHLLIG